jgi:REP element-mobilizing transposase RayT
MLPHIQPENSAFFITFRLAGSLPVSLLDRIQDEKLEKMARISKSLSPSEYHYQKNNIEKQYFAIFDDCLHKILSGPIWLEKSEIAQIVTQRLIDDDEARYHLWAFCIMPNHVHILLKQNTNLDKIMKYIKGKSAVELNKHLQRKGKFWAEGYFDKAIRDDEHFVRVYNYIKNNALKAGLTDERVFSKYE